MGWLLPGYVTFTHSWRHHAVNKHRHSSHVGHCFPSAVVSEHPCLPARHSADFWTSLGADLKFWWTVFKENYNSGQLGGEGEWDEGTVETQSSFPQSSALIRSIYTACDERISALAASHSYQLPSVMFRDTQGNVPPARCTTIERGWKRGRCEWRKASQQTWHSSWLQSALGLTTRRTLVRGQEFSSWLNRGLCWLESDIFGGWWAQDTSWRLLINLINRAMGRASQGSRSISWLLIGATRWTLEEASWTSASSAQWAG